MKKQINFLVKLQEEDRGLARLRWQMREGPERLQGLEKELQRPVGLGSVLLVAGDFRQCIEDLVQILVLHGIGALEGPIRFANPADPAEAAELHRLSIQRRGKQRGLFLAVGISSVFDHRVGIRLDHRKVVGPF